MKRDDGGGVYSYFCDRCGGYVGTASQRYAADQHEQLANCVEELWRQIRALREE